MQFNREWHAGGPADHSSEAESQQEAGDYEDDEMAEEVDPADAAPGGGESSDSGMRRMPRSTPGALSQEIGSIAWADFSPRRVYWLDKDTHSRKTKRPSEARRCRSESCRGPMQSVPGMPARAAAEATAKPKPETIDLPS
eukprot:7401134-Pyramimonas_sp.AAC.1